MHLGPGLGIAGAMASTPESGNCVEVFGLESEGGMALNGKKGIVSNLIGFKGRLEVRLSADKKVSLKPENLRPCELTVQERLAILGLGAAPSQPIDPSGGQLPYGAGDRVEIFGLTSETGQSLNGQLGSVVRFLADAGRFEVRLADSKLSHVRLENLRKAAATEGAEPAAAPAGGVQARSRSRSRSQGRAQEGPVDKTEPPSGEEAPFKPGQCVEVFGLASESGKALNVETGIVGRYLPDTGRVEVRFAEKTVGLNPDNLRKVSFEISTPAPAAADEQRGETEDAEQKPEDA